MASDIFIRNLPDNITDQALRDFIGSHVEILEINIREDDNPNTSTQQAHVRLNVPRYDAEELAKRYHGRIMAGRKLAVYVSLYG